MYFQNTTIQKLEFTHFAQNSQDIIVIFSNTVKTFRLFFDYTILGLKQKDILMTSDNII